MITEKLEDVVIESTEAVSVYEYVFWFVIVAPDICMLPPVEVKLVKLIKRLVDGFNANETL